MRINVYSGSHNRQELSRRKYQLQRERCLRRVRAIEARTPATIDHNPTFELFLSAAGFTCGAVAIVAAIAKLF